MKKLITALVSSVCIFLLAAFGPDKETDYPAAIMVDGVNILEREGHSL